MYPGLYGVDRAKKGQPGGGQKGEARGGGEICARNLPIIDFFLVTCP